MEKARSPLGASKITSNRGVAFGRLRFFVGGVMVVLLGKRHTWHYGCSLSKHFAPARRKYAATSGASASDAVSPYVTAGMEATPVPHSMRAS